MLIHLLKQLVQKIKEIGKLMANGDTGIMSPGDLPYILDDYVPKPSRKVNKDIIKAVAIGVGVTGILAVNTPTMALKAAPIVSAWVSKNITFVTETAADIIKKNIDNITKASELAKIALAKEEKELAELWAKVKKLEAEHRILHEVPKTVVKGLKKNKAKIVQTYNTSKKAIVPVIAKNK